MKIAPRNSEDQSQGGVGLIELLVYSALLLVVLSVVGGMLVTMLTVQRNVVNEANSVTRAHLIAQSLETGIRNSTAVKLEGNGSGSQFLLARSATGSPTASFTCIAWYYSLESKSVRYRRSSTAITFPTSTDLAGWTVLGDEVQPVSNGGIFQLVGSRLNLNFSQRSEAPVTITTSISTRGGSWESAPCF